MFNFLQCDALTALRTLPDESVNCCVTSPPYWGLRDYGVGPLVWGGEPGCEHEWTDASWKPARWGVHDDDTPGEKQRTNNGSLGHRGGVKEQAICSLCGAWRGSLGLEPTPELYVSHLVEVFREVRRVLGKDGTLWLNLGDSYSGGGNNRGGNPAERSCKQKTNRGGYGQIATPVPTGLKPKDLIGIPWRVAFALQADGWWLRSDIVWCKGNGMPESVKDRPTRAHEYVFLLAKSERYYYDAASVAEPVKADTPARYGRGRSDSHKYTDGGPGGQTIARTLEHMAKQDGHGRRHAGFNEREFAGDPRAVRNLRSWWLINTLPTPEAHFATMPITLAERCVRAGCPESGTVLDPFAGAGTTGLACLKHGRKFLGIELNPAYIEIAHARANKYYPLLAGAPA